MVEGWERSRPGRIALRQEGPFWNAYYALPDTMAGAIHLGSLHLRFAAMPERKAEFKRLMQGCVADLMHEVFGVRPIWPDGPQPAPERERAGHG